MKKSLKILSIIIFAFTMLIISNRVYAESEVCKVKISSDKTSLNIGDTVTIGIKLTDVVSEEGITELAGMLDYDQDIFEIVYETDSSIEDEIGLDDINEELGIDNLKIAYYDEEGWFVGLAEIDGSDEAALAGINLGDPLTSDAKIGEIKLKVKSTAVTTTTGIELNSLSAIDAEEEEYELESESSINLTINAKSSKDDKVKTQTESNKTTANQAAPYAGKEDILPLILTVAIIAIVTFVGIKKYKNI